MDNILDIKNINYKYKKENFEISNISFSLPKGYIMGLVGNNGSGKTTLFNILSGQIKDYTGYIYVDGVNIKKNKVYLHNNVAFISEKQPFFLEKNVLENANLYSKYYDTFDYNGFNNYLNEFEIPQSTPIGKLSKGTFIKFQFAFASAHNPKLYIMDEPTAGLDPVFRKEFLSILQNTVENNTSVLFSTHITSDLEKIADYITNIHDGKIVFSKDIETLKEEYYSNSMNVDNIFHLKDIL